MGGISSERSISIETGEQVFKAIKDTFNVSKIIVDKDLKKLIDQLDNENPDFVFNALHGKFGEDG